MFGCCCNRQCKPNSQIEVLYYTGELEEECGAFGGYDYPDGSQYEIHKRSVIAETDPDIVTDTVPGDDLCIFPKAFSVDWVGPGYYKGSGFLVWAREYIYSTEFPSLSEPCWRTKARFHGPISGTACYYNVGTISDGPPHPDEFPEPDSYVEVSIDEDETFDLVAPDPVGTTDPDFGHYRRWSQAIFILGKDYNEIEWPFDGDKIFSLS